MTVWVLVEVGLELFAAIAVLDRAPEGQGQRVAGGVRMAGLALARRRRAVALASGAKVPSGSPRIGFELGQAFVLDAVPERQLEGDFALRRQFRNRRRGCRAFGEAIYRPGVSSTSGASSSPASSLEAQPKGADRMSDVLDQLFAQILKEHPATMTQMVADPTRHTDFTAPDQPFPAERRRSPHRQRCRRP